MIPLRSLSEVGIGQSRAVSRAARLCPAGLLWHERHRGLHLGLGAELPETFDPKLRTTGHHLDVVLATGSLRRGTHLMMRW